MGWTEGATDFVLTQIPMLTSWDTPVIGVHGVHELLTPKKLTLPKKGPEFSDGWTSDNRRSELMDGYRAGWTVGYERRWTAILGMDWHRLVDGFDGFDGFDGWLASNGFDGGTRGH